MISDDKILKRVKSITKENKDNKNYRKLYDDYKDHVTEDFMIITKKLLILH